MASSVVMQLTIPVDQKMSTALTKLITQSAFKVIKRGQQKKKEKKTNITTDDIAILWRK